MIKLHHQNQTLYFFTSHILCVTPRILPKWNTNPNTGVSEQTKELSGSYITIGGNEDMMFAVDEKPDEVIALTKFV